MFLLQNNSSYAGYRTVPIQAGPSESVAAKWMTRIAWAHFALMWGAIALIHGVSESWWPGTMVVYLPRIPWVVPALILIPLSVRFGWKPLLINTTAGLLAIGPVMNWQSGGLFRPAVDRQAYQLTVVSCNVQSFRPKFDQVVVELNRIGPDIVLFQEAFEDHALLATLFDGWHVHRVDEYLVASKLPLKFVSTLFVPGFERVTAVRYEVETPLGPVAVFNVHQTSPRRSLTQLKPWSPLIGSGIETVEQETTLRDVEALKTRAFTAPEGLNQPVLITGDFNMPNDSSLFRRHWGNLQDAYALTAVGYGYTSPCSQGRLWPGNTPWAQVDHILANKDWQVERCWIGESAGSDHRLIAAQLRLPNRKPAGR